MHKVAIITRTKNRNLFLQRALSSVLKQTFRDFLWVIVNDGGPTDPVNAIAEQARHSNIDVKLIHRDESTGMEAASNHGIRESESEYIVIHDDDDSWQSGFLEKTVSFLDCHACYGGVVTWTELIYEKIKDKRFQTNKRKIENRIAAITIADMLAYNLFPPVAFLYRRSAFEKVGPYDEAFPVCGDYEFNLRFIEAFDIGVVPTAEANHHFRPALTERSDPNGNTEIAQRKQHVLSQVRIRNKLFRRDLERRTVGIGVLLQVNAMHAKAYRFAEICYDMARIFKPGKD
jgi:glycosyltransferase involved in cell wall biosynthesis